ncbi:hypothetical protein K440DRAFT_667142 [Wilcoxina mikolae CBS 423.85]|nr:hypothetical protein K440DRAFT_667142 [Wilcoxina mikolae CBS 423.85]
MRTPRKHRSGYTRSKSGCLTCRKSHVKCIETHPECPRCVRLDLICQWHTTASPVGNSARTGYVGHSGASPGLTSDRAPGGIFQAPRSDNGINRAEASGHGFGSASDGGSGGRGKGATSSSSSTGGVSLQLQSEEMLTDYNRHGDNSAAVSEESTQHYELQDFSLSFECNAELREYLGDEFEQFFGNGAVLGEHDIGDVAQNWGYNSTV